MAAGGDDGDDVYDDGDDDDDNYDADNEDDNDGVWNTHSQQKLDQQRNKFNHTVTLIYAVFRPESLKEITGHSKQNKIQAVAGGDPDDLTQNTWLAWFTKLTYDR